MTKARERKIPMFTRKAPQIYNQNSISELSNITLGKLEQWIYIRGVNEENPILLMLHGGPGAAQIGFIRTFQQELEKHFVVINWDQRGSGLSYTKKIPLETMNINQFVDDTIELTDYLINRFNKNKIYLVGLSWGTMLGILAVSHSPELYKRYFGIAQVANYIAGEKLSYKILPERAKIRNNKKALYDLIKIGPPPWKNLKHDRLHQKYLDEFGGRIVHDGKFIRAIFKELLRSKEYTLFDIVKLLKGQYFSMKNLQQEMRELDLIQAIKTIKIPCYFCMGRHDLTVPYQITEKLFNLIQAPEKHWIWFENSAHSPNFEEQEKFTELIVGETRKDIKKIFYEETDEGNHLFDIIRLFNFKYLLDNSRFYN